MNLTQLKFRVSALVSTLSLIPIWYVKSKMFPERSDFETDRHQHRLDGDQKPDQRGETSDRFFRSGGDQARQERDANHPFKQVVGFSDLHHNSPPNKFFFLTVNCCAGQRANNINLFLIASASR